MATVLIVEDDEVLAGVMRRHLTQAGHDVEWAADGERGLKKLPFPVKMRISVLEPVTFDVEPGLERYPRSLVLEESERIRERIQEEVFEMLKARRSIWKG